MKEISARIDIEAQPPRVRAVLIDLGRPSRAQASLAEVNEALKHRAEAG